MKFSSKEYWSGLPFPPPGHLPDPRIAPTSPALAGGFFTTEPRGKPTFQCSLEFLWTHALQKESWVSPAMLLILYVVEGVCSHDEQSLTWPFSHQTVAWRCWPCSGYQRPRPGSARAGPAERTAASVTGSTRRMSLRSLRR